MYNRLLDSFFKTSGVADDGNTSAQALFHFHLKADANPEAGNALNDVMHEIFNETLAEEHPQRVEDMEKEKNEIAAADSFEQIVRMIRRGIDPLNKNDLIDKALEFEQDIIPDLVRRLRTNMMDTFIETAVRVIAKSKINVSEEIINYYDSMRSPYAQSLVLIYLGFKADESVIPWLIEKYHQVIAQFPDENYSDGAYYAIYEMDSRFYGK